MPIYEPDDGLGAFRGLVFAVGIMLFLGAIFLAGLVCVRELLR